MKRVELARQVNMNDLESVSETLSNPGYREVLGQGDAARGMDEPVLTDDIRALLIMTQCIARFMGTYWDVRRLSGIDQPREWKPSQPGVKWRALTGVPVGASFEDWRSALNSFVGGLGK
jgi:hypothetical protein